jgi:hypothetical protein
MFSRDSFRFVSGINSTRSARSVVAKTFDFFFFFLESLSFNYYFLIKIFQRILHAREPNNVSPLRYFTLRYFRYVTMKNPSKGTARSTGHRRGSQQLDDEDSPESCPRPHISHMIRKHEDLTSADDLMLDTLTPHTRLGLEEGFRAVTDLPSANGSGFQVRSTDTTYSSSSEGSASSRSLTDAKTRRSHLPSFEIDAPVAHTDPSGDDAQAIIFGELADHQSAALTKKPHSLLGAEKGPIPVTHSRFFAGDSGSKETTDTIGSHVHRRFTSSSKNQLVFSSSSCNAPAQS